MDKRSWRSAQGKLRPYYVKVAGGTTQGSAKDDVQLAALIERVQARKPGVALVVVSIDRQGGRTERPVNVAAESAATFTAVAAAA